MNSLHVETTAIYASSNFSLSGLMTTASAVLPAPTPIYSFNIPPNIAKEMKNPAHAAK